MIMKVVINKCYGGFGISHEAVMLYLELAGTPVFPEHNKKYEWWDYWLVPVEERFVSKEWDELTVKEKIEFNEKTVAQRFDPHEIARDDKFLVQAVEQLGEAANNRYSELAVVEIPDDVEWHISEYDGEEWVAENHRTWS